TSQFKLMTTEAELINSNTRLLCNTRLHSVANLFHERVIKINTIIKTNDQIIQLESIISARICSESFKYIGSNPHNIYAMIPVGISLFSVIISPPHFQNEYINFSSFSVKKQWICFIICCTSFLSEDACIIMILEAHQNGRN